MADEVLSIPPRFRLALGAKGVALAALAGLFVFLGAEAFGRWHWPLLARVSALGLTLFAGAFLAWAATLALVDVALGKAVRSHGARPLKTRRSGYSLELPGGGFVEYILYNPWQPLQQGATYTVVYGRRSRVLVAPPELETHG